MAFNELEKKAVEKELENFLGRKRPPRHLRSEIDIQYLISGQTVIIEEVRPYWRDKSQQVRNPLAKLTYVRSRDIWKIYWMGKTMQWQSYAPNPEAEKMEEALGIIEEDSSGCFFG